MTDNDPSIFRLMRPWRSLVPVMALGACTSSDPDAAADADMLGAMTDSSQAPKPMMPTPISVPSGGAPSTAAPASNPPAPNVAPVGSGTGPGEQQPSPSAAAGAGGASGNGSTEPEPEPPASQGGGGSTSDGDPPQSGGRPNQVEHPGMGGGNAAGMGGGDGVGGTPQDEEPVIFATCPDATWNVVWGDDFDGPAGSAVDGGKWAYDSGPNWYNGELQTYTTGTDNASLDGSGNLVIEARREDREGRQYTSARLKTENKHTFTYGRMESRMKLPYGQGMWPAFWMLGGNSWPSTGEIDIMENLGREPTIAHGTIHGPGYSGANGPGTPYTLPGGAKFSDDFHVFAIEWEPNEIRWYIDGDHYATKTPADIGGNQWVFDHPFFFIVNLAVGGEWPGNPDQTTVFPQRFLIDYIRVCEQ